jgi:anti-sigma regulatory factor (Ser/Thr protein kinase)
VYEHAAIVYVIDRGADLDAVPSELVPCALLDDRQPVKTEDVATGGRGLFLVSSLSIAWTVSLVEKGKAVIAVLALNGDER